MNPTDQNWTAKRDKRKPSPWARLLFFSCGAKEKIRLALSFQGASRWNIIHWRNRLQGHLRKPSYVLFVLIVSAFNAFVPFFPVELFMMLRILVRPREWFPLTITTSAASSIGNVGLAWLVEVSAKSSLLSRLVHHFDPSSWEHTTLFIRHHGTLGLGVISISFLPLPPGVIMCALSRVSYWEIAISIGVGHCLKYGLFGWFAACFPRSFDSVGRNSLC